MSDKSKLFELRSLAHESRQIQFALRKLESAGSLEPTTRNRYRSRILAIRARLGAVQLELGTMPGASDAQRLLVRRLLGSILSSLREGGRVVFGRNDPEPGRPGGWPGHAGDRVEEPGPSWAGEVSDPPVDLESCPVCERPPSPPTIACIRCRSLHHAGCWILYSGCGSILCEE